MCIIALFVAMFYSYLSILSLYIDITTTFQQKDINANATNYFLERIMSKMQ